MTYKEFVDNKYRDYILIKLTDSFPYYIEKVICKNGEKHVDKKYHIADGMFSTYINYEMPENGISAELSSMRTRFEITGKYDCPVYVVNAGGEDLEISVFGWGTSGMLNSGEVLPIYPPELAEETRKAFEQIRLEEFCEGKKLLQSEINSLLGGN